ncbi:MAG TPA: hypothetical protein PLX71_11335 [Phycicoccus sp.]|nr:hypothetical protein [Phycicoccus sp.]
MSSVWTRRLAPLAVIAALLPAGCGTPRTPEAFCTVYHEQKDAYLSKYNAAAKDIENTKDPLTQTFAGLGMALGAMGDVVTIFDKLDKVAPDDIEPDVAKIRDSLQKQIDTAGNSISDPLGGLASGLMSALTTQGSWQRVNEYVVAHCGEKG